MVCLANKNCDSLKEAWIAPRRVVAYGEDGSDMIKIRVIGERSLPGSSDGRIKNS